jgi:sulfide:quinone oxidoreductase
MNPRIVVLGAGFGGLELSTILSEALGDHLDLTLIDKNDSFFFGFSKFDVMFGHQTADAVRLSYSNIVKPGVRFRQETITSIDPETRRVTTDNGTYEADVLVVALGADYDLAATPGLIEGGNEFYSFAGAERLREVLPTFSKGRAIVGVTSAPFKCPPAPSEAASLLAEVQGGEQTPAFAGAGTCYVEFGGGRVGRVDVDFLSGPSPTGSFIEPSVALVGEKQHFGSTRRARWFGL